MKDIIEQFIRQVEEDQKFSQNTKSAYRSDLNDLIVYVTHTKSQISDINHEWVKTYLKHLEEINTERNSYNRRASTFRIFLRFLYLSNLVPSNFALIVDNVSVLNKSTEDELKSEDVHKIIEDSGLTKEQKLLLWFIGKLKLTATQISSLQTFQMNFETRSINLSDTERIELPQEVFLLLRDYLLDVRPNIPGANEQLNLFLNEKGKPINETDIYKLIKKLSEDAGLSGKLTTRNLKKSLDNKNDILSIQREIMNVISPN